MIKRCVQWVAVVAVLCMLSNCGDSQTIAQASSAVDATSGDLAQLVDAVSANGIEIGDVVTVVPSLGLPTEVSPANANNNLDVVRHQGLH